MIYDNYSSFNLSALRRSNGNQREADYLLDTSYFSYYNTLSLYNKWAKEQNDAMKDKTKNNG